MANNDLGNQPGECLHSVFSQWQRFSNVCMGSFMNLMEREHFFIYVRLYWSSITLGQELDQLFLHILNLHVKKEGKNKLHLLRKAF